MQRYRSRKEASEYCGNKGCPISVATLAKYATTGGGPVFRSFGRFPRYTDEDLDAWIASRLSPPADVTSRHPVSPIRRGRPPRPVPVNNDAATEKPAGAAADSRYPVTESRPATRRAPREP